MSSTRPYYGDFPAAPADLIEDVTELALFDAPVIEAHVGMDNSLFLDVAQDEDCYVTIKDLQHLALVCGTDIGDVYVEPSKVEGASLSITFAATMFDFTESFKGTRFEHSPLLGIGLHDEPEDEEEIVLVFHDAEETKEAIAQGEFKEDEPNPEFEELVANNAQYLFNPEWEELVAEPEKPSLLAQVGFAAFLAAALVVEVVSEKIQKLRQG